MGVLALLDTELQHSWTLEQEPEFRNLENTDSLIRNVERIYLLDKEKEMQRPELRVWRMNTQLAGGYLKKSCDIDCCFNKII